MKYYELTKEEKQILKDYEDGKFVPAKNLNKVKRELKLVAKNTLDKTKNINIFDSLVAIIFLSVFKKGIT